MSRMLNSVLMVQTCGVISTAAKTKQRITSYQVQTPCPATYQTPPADMRKGINGLSGLVSQGQLDPLNGHLFIFISTRIYDASCSVGLEVS